MSLCVSISSIFSLTHRRLAKRIQHHPTLLDAFEKCRNRRPNECNTLNPEVWTQGCKSKIYPEFLENKLKIFVGEHAPSPSFVGRSKHSSCAYPFKISRYAPGMRGNVNVKRLRDTSNFGRKVEKLLYMLPSLYEQRVFFFRCLFRCLFVVSRSCPDCFHLVLQSPSTTTL